ncbi:MAG: type II secretion system F family protein [Acidimicrobiia bacterium]
MKDRAALVAVGLGGALLLGEPVVGAVAGAGWLGWWLVARMGARRARARESEEAVDALARVLVISLSAGLPLAAALEMSVPQLPDPVSGEVRAVLRRARRHGIAAALSQPAAIPGCPGSLPDQYCRRLFLQLARAQLTGAPVAATVAGFLEGRRSAARSRALEEARRLPVKLLVPLTLLVLPGFIALTVGPTFVSTLRRLLQPVVGSP